eukprot:scaffold127845_cov84-Attheya_sp.AAC.1
MEAPEQVSEPPAHYMTPPADTPDRQRYAASLRPCCCDASITVTIDVTGGDGWVWVGVGFIGISLVEAPAVKRGGCGACGKGTNGGKWGETVFWGDTKPVVVCGATGW